MIMSRAYRLTFIQKLFIQQRLLAAGSQQNVAFYSLERLSGHWTRSILCDSFAMQSLVVQRQLLHTSRKQYLGLINIRKNDPAKNKNVKVIILAGIFHSVCTHVLIN